MSWPTWIGIGVAIILAVVAYPVLSMYFKPAVRLAAAEATPGDQSATGGVHAFTLTANDGSEYPLAALAGKAVLLVNTASRCGLTGQYDGLQDLHERFHERGLVVVAIPANDFMGQEPGSNDEIAEFCQVRFGVGFPLMAKSTVRGEGQHPLYAWLTNDSPLPGPISWNFEKFLVGGDGHLVARFSPRTSPTDARILEHIEQTLATLPAAETSD